MITIVPTLFDYVLSDAGAPSHAVPKNDVEQLFSFFKQHPLFNWKRTHNGCEGRADAVCVLLDEWGISNYKAWVFGGTYLKNHIGGLKNNWNYHVAPVLPVEENGQIIYYVLDPATTGSPQPIEEWAAAITQLPHSYYCIRQAHWYIFPEKRISITKWHTRNRQNRKWMIQCLAGINGLSSTGKARLCFNKMRIRNTASAFEQLKKEKAIIDLTKHS